MDKESLYAMIGDYETYMMGRYRDLYVNYGKINDPKGSGNLSCPNKSGHLGVDAHPSMSVNNETGAFKCFTCGIAGYFSQFHKHFIGGSIIDFIESTSTLKRSMYDSADEDVRIQDKEYAAIVSELTGKRKVMEAARSYCETDRDRLTVPGGREIVNECCERLAENQAALDWWKRERFCNPNKLRALHIGMKETGEFTIPLITTDGQVLNIKSYNPAAVNKRDKWQYEFEGFPTNLPFPYSALTESTIVFFEGEPDAITAFGCDIDGAFTLGACSNIDIDRIFGERIEEILTGKDCIIVFDIDGPGREWAAKLAAKLYKYAMQVKILNLANGTNGLDETSVGDNGKLTKKDFTDWAKQFKSAEDVRKEFWNLVAITDAFVFNEDRSSDATAKISVFEANKSAFYDSDGTHKIEMMVQISSVEEQPYNFTSKLRFTCHRMKDRDYSSPSCKDCLFSKRKQFNEKGIKSFELDIVVGYEENDDDNIVMIKPNAAVGLINQSRREMDALYKQHLDITASCRTAKFEDVAIKRVTVSTITNCTTGAKISTSNDQDVNNAIASVVDSEATVVIVHDKAEDYVAVEVNKPYKITGHAITSWNNNFNMIFATSISPLETSIDKFRTSQDLHTKLKRVFQPAEWSIEEIENTLTARYDALSSAAGLTGRNNLFFINDLAFFSQIHIDIPDVLPTVGRGWVEVFIIGDSRCGKSMATSFLHKHYQFGETIGSSSGSSRSGVLGGITTNNNGKKVISWGKVPKNNNGLVSFEETGRLDMGIISDMTEMRTSGLYELNMVKSGSAMAKTRKIFLSNPRDENHGYGSTTGGVEMLRDIFGKDEAITRFDFGTLVKVTDVDLSSTEVKYRPVPIDLDSRSCQELLRYSLTRNTGLVKYEEGFGDAIRKAAKELQDKYSQGTFIINVEIRAKLARLANSIAGMLYSVDDGDIETLVVRNVFVEYAKMQYIKESNGNLKFDTFTYIDRASNRLGNVEFLKSILTNSILNTLLGDGEVDEFKIKSIFAHYLNSVQRGEKYLVEPDTGRRLTAIPVSNTASMFFSTLVALNCYKQISKTKRYMKTSGFADWLMAYFNEVGHGNFLPNDGLDVKSAARNGEDDQVDPESSFTKFGA